MGLFKKRKKKRNIDDFLDEYSLKEEDILKSHDAQHQAMSLCEQMIETTKELDESKKEYRLVTNYLKDVEILEELPQEEKGRLQETAKNIAGLNQVREEYLNKKKRLSDVQFMQMEQLEEEIVDDIHKLKTNENYQSMIKRDMTYLEGEKSEWNYYQESIATEQKFLKVALVVVFAILVVGIVVLEYVHYYMYKDMTLPIMLFLFIVAVISVLCILRMNNNRKEWKRSTANINRAIVLSNRMKAKYVNVTNAVDYACERFHVRNSMELTYIWEQYLEAVKEREIAEKTNEDLDYFSRKLVRELKQYQLYDSAIWVGQVEAILDKKEMVEVKHYLLVRRQKLRQRMEKQVGEIQESKNRIMALAKNNQKYQKEILEVVRSIDKMCGV